MDIAAELRELARNLYWTWHPHTVAMFRDLDAALWREVNHNPVEFLSRFTPEELERRASELGLQARINYAAHRLEDYISSTRTWGSYHAGPLNVRPVAYFSAEFGIHESLPIYGGGLGVLAGDQLKSASDLGVPMVGVGLFYAKGYFSQQVDADGRQQERYFEADVEHLPLDRALGPGGRPAARARRDPHLRHPPRRLDRQRRAAAGWCCWTATWRRTPSRTAPSPPSSTEATSARGSARSSRSASAACGRCARSAWTPAWST